MLKNKMKFLLLGVLVGTGNLISAASSGAGKSNRFAALAVDDDSEDDSAKPSYLEAVRLGAVDKGSKRAVKCTSFGRIASFASETNGILNVTSFAEESNTWFLKKGEKIVLELEAVSGRAYYGHYSAACEFKGEVKMRDFRALD